MNAYAKLAVAVVIVITVGAIGLAVIRPGSSQVGAPSASPSPAASAAPSASPSSAAIPGLTETFSSANHGYSVRHPAGATTGPATARWWPPDASAGYEGMDFIRDQQLGVFRAASAVVPDDASIDDWIDRFITGAEAGTCNPPRATLPEISVDGQSGRIRDGCPDEMEATVVVGRRAYVFTLFSDSRAAFDAIMATVKLDPDDAVAATPICTQSGCMTGALDPGTYALNSGRVTPRQVTFTVPAGWTTEEGFIVKHGTVPRPGAPEPPDQVMLFTWGNISQVLADVCPTTETMVDPGETAAELAGVLAAQKGRVASAVTDVTLGGVPAKRLELTVPTDLDTTPCGGVLRFWSDPGGGLCCSAVGSTDVVYIIGSGPDRFVVVARHQPGSSPADMAELQGILDSMVIEAPTAAPAPSAAGPAGGPAQPSGPAASSYEAVFLRLEVVDESPVVIVVGVDGKGHERQIARLPGAWLAFDIKSGNQGYLAPTGVVSPGGLLAIPSEHGDRRMRWEVYDLHRPDGTPLSIPGIEQFFERVQTEPFYLPNVRGGAFWGPGERLAIAWYDCRSSCTPDLQVTFIEGRTGATSTVDIPADVIALPQWTSDGSGIFVVQSDDWYGGGGQFARIPPSGILRRDGTLVDETAGDQAPNCRTTGNQCVSPDGTMVVHGITSDADRPTAALTAIDTAVRFDVQGRFAGWLGAE